MEESHKPIASAADVDIIVTKMASQLVKDYPESPLFVALLRGGAPFATKLMFAITKQAPQYHPELDYMVVSTYGQDRTASEPVIITDLAPSTNPGGRDIIILDDVIDKGLTSDFVHELLVNRGAKSVKLAVLVDKKVEGRLSQADYAGLTANDQWLIGMGLDDAKSGHEHHRWSESIWEIHKQ